MSVSDLQGNIVAAFFKAMQAGRAAEAELMALFADDAVLTEPFTGAIKTHTGIDAVRNSFRCTWENPFPDVALTVNRVDLDGARVRAEWTCSAPVFPSPIRGHDLFDIRDGKIARLEIVVTEMPDMSGVTP
jgi:ketosteroid isomerase-like protein